ncbi:MAG: carbohydrate-binding family 9-like protein [Pirellulales bacterium]|nr:carbohydrate-binding family 9-like protein [Pirellulales bacterium]
MDANAPEPPKTYEVRRVAGSAVGPEGRLGEAAWDRAEPLVDFHFPWTAGPSPATEFRALCDDRRLFFRFVAMDDDLVLVDDFRDKMDVVHEDRVEVFLACDPRLRRYFALEIDPLGRTLDYEAAFHRQFDRAWTCPGLAVAAAVLPEGYRVDASIPLAVLEELRLGRLDSPDGILAGLFRAEFRHGANGETVEDWMSWVNPATDRPDFHVPSAFGRLRRAP